MILSQKERLYMVKQPYKVVDLFSGVGGMSLGFDQPSRLNGLADLGYSGIEIDGRGFETVLAVEKEENAAAGFEHNFNSAMVVHSDIRKIDDFTAWDDAHVVIGGPPCQGFSNLNSTKTENLSDDRNDLWRDFLRAVREIQPHVFVVENVPRFLDTEEASGLAEEALDIGYEVVAGRLDAELYGVPQKRTRAFVIGSRKGKPFLPGPPPGPIRTVRDAISNLPAEPTGKNYHVGREVTDRTSHRMAAVPPGGNRLDIPEEHLPDCWKDYPDNHGTDLYGRLWWDKPSVTIRADFVKPEKGRYLHPEADRSITMREGARLQTFPDDFEFGTKYKKYVTSQIGNAVPPKLAYHVGVALHRHLDGLKADALSDLECGGIEEAQKIEWDRMRPLEATVTLGN